MIIISILFILENSNVVHTPFLRYVLSVFFILMLLFLFKAQKRNKLYYSFLVYPVIIFSIVTFVRGFETDDLSIKKYLSSTYSFYFFPLLMLIRIDEILLKFLKSTVYFSVVINLSVLFTLPFWLESSFYTDQISRTLLSISGISFFFLLPYVTRHRVIIILNFIFAISLNVFMARRAESFFLGGIFIYTLLEGLKWNPLKNSLLIILTIASLLFITSFDGFGNNLLKRYDEGFENREVFFEEVLFSLSEKNSFIFGDGAQATYYSDTRNEDRNIVEHGYYDMLLRSGLIFVTLFCLIAILAAFRGFFKSNNTFTRRLAVYIVLYLILMFGHGVFEFSYRVFFLWLSISICLSDNFFKIKDMDVLKYIK